MFYARAQATMMAVRKLPLLAFAWRLLPTGVMGGLASCCVNSTSGLGFADDCVCLVDNTQLTGQFLAAWETRLYHWVLTMNNSELVSGSVRGNLTFEMAPCNGSASIDIKSGGPSSWQHLPSVNSSGDHNPSSITIPVKFTEHVCIVTAGGADTMFDIAVHTTLYDRPTPGNAGSLSAEMLASGVARVLISTTENDEADDVMYSLYWSNLADTNEGACTEGSGNTTLRGNPNCLFWSACGLEHAAQGHTDWLTLEANIDHAFEVPVDDELSYLFNVVMIDARNITTVYSGTNVSFTSLDYQGCVADPGCESQLNEDSTIITIVATAMGVLTLLITAMKFLHTSIAKVMQETVATRNKPSADRSFDLFGTKGVKETGKVHPDNVGEVGNKPTPTATSVRHSDGKSGPGKERRTEKEEVVFADAVLLAGQREEGPSRGSPKQGPPASPSSKSPLRIGQAQSSMLPDTNDSDPENGESDNGGGGGGGGSSVTNIRKISTPRRSGDGTAGEGSDGNQDDARAAPRSDLDNTTRSADSGGKHRQDADGTRTHKTPRGLPNSHRESPRDRKPSPRENIKSYNDGNGSGGEQGERNAGLSPRKRRAVVKGGWEREMMRTGAVQSPRMRKTKLDRASSRYRDRGQDQQDSDSEDDGYRR